MSGFFIGLAVGVVIALPVLVIATRRTERRVKRLLERAQAAERLAEQATMTSGLAHEIKNPLSSINLNAQLVREDLVALAQQLPPDTPGTPGNATQLAGRIERRFDALTRETQRLRDILEDFLRFAGRLQLEPQSIDVNTLVAELADFFAPQAQAANVRVRTQLDANPSSLVADPDHLKQALLNLMINACQVMSASRGDGRPSGGSDELMLRTERRRAGDSDEVLLHVIDTGPGISEENARRIFQPYFSTRKGGTGLGLPTSRRIAEAHGGTLTFHTEAGKGTIFTIALPANAGGAAEAQSV